MGRLVLHIGTHKTATTSIQRFLRSHDKELLRRGVCYPSYELIGKGSHYAHFGIVNALSGDHKTLTAQDARDFFAHVGRVARDHELTILSAESFYRQGWDRMAKSRSDYWQVRKDYIHRIRDMFDEADVVVVFRAQAEYADSLYQESVKVTKLGINFQTFLQRNWPHFAYAEQAGAWNEAFPGLTAMSYHKLVESGDAVAEFCRLLSIPIDGLPPAERFNEGMHPDLVLLKRMVNGSQLGKEVLKTKLTRLGAVLQGSKMNEQMNARLPHSFFADERARQAFHESHIQGNETLRRFMCHSFAPGEPVLPLKLRPVKTYGDEASPELLLDLIDRAIKSKGKARKPTPPTDIPAALAEGTTGKPAAPQEKPRSKAPSVPSGPAPAQRSKPAPGLLASLRRHAAAVARSFRKG